LIGIDTKVSVKICDPLTYVLSDFTLEELPARNVFIASFPTWKYDVSNGLTDQYGSSLSLVQYCHIWQLQGYFTTQVEQKLTLCTELHDWQFFEGEVRRISRIPSLHIRLLFDTEQPKKKDASSNGRGNAIML
jgi:hypothetical protein